MPQDFEFIEVTPSSSGGSTNRRRIRSHAARAGNTTDRAIVPNEPNQRTRNRNRRAIVWPLTVEPIGETGRVEEVPRDESAGPVQLWRNAGLGARSVVDNHVLLPFAGNNTVMPISQSRLYPLPFLSLVLNNYIDHLTGAIPEVDGPAETDLLKKYWFPMVLHSKTLFQIIVLFSASHYASRRNYQAFARDIFFLKHCALRDLQIALRNSQTFASDENIAAVGKMAGYEAVYGTEAAYNVHMNGLEQMLRYRGGLSALGMDGFLARLLIFIDTNSAFLLNTRQRLTEPNFPRQEPWIPPNLNKFIG